MSGLDVLLCSARQAALIRERAEYLRADLELLATRVRLSDTDERELGRLRDEVRSLRALIESLGIALGASAT